MLNLKILQMTSDEQGQKSRRLHVSTSVTYPNIYSTEKRLGRQQEES
jgi:hypothetical protein